jgi:tRNA G46 methylase TrmB
MTIGQNDNGEVTGHDIQLKKIAKQIETLAKETKERIRILELGCGMGYNIKYLAKRFPDAQFIGIDITKSYIRKAKSKTKGLENVSIQLIQPIIISCLILKRFVTLKTINSSFPKYIIV